MRKLSPIPPGEILSKEFLEPLGISQSRLARDIDVSSTRVNDVIHGRRAITADMALRLARYLGTSPELWMGLQMEYDLRKAQRDCGSTIVKRIRPVKAA